MDVDEGSSARRDGGSDGKGEASDAEKNRASQLTLLLKELRTSNGSERADLLVRLDEDLRASAFSGPLEFSDVVVALGHASNDVRRIVLAFVADSCARAAGDSQSVKKGKEVHLSCNTMIQPVLLTGKRALASSATSVTACQAAAQAGRAIAELVKHGQHAPVSVDANMIIDFALAMAGLGLSTLSQPIDNGSRKVRQAPGTALNFMRAPAAGAPRTHSSASVQHATNSLNALAIKRQSSSSSLQSTSAQSIASSSGYASDRSLLAASASDTDADAANCGDQTARRLAAAQRIARKEAIACIEMLNSHCPGTLLAKWPEILCSGHLPALASLSDVIESDPFVSNCVAACRTIELILSTASRQGYLAGVEEGRRMLSFTSLSNRLASAVAHTRARLKTALLRKRQLIATEHILRCAKVLVESTKHIKLLSSHAQILRPVALELCSRKESSIAIAAFSLLTVLPNTDTIDDLPNADNMLIPALTTADDAIRTSTWHIVAQSSSAGEVLSKESIEKICGIASQQLKTAGPAEVREAIAKFVVECVKKGAGGKDLQSTLATICKDSSATVRGTAAEALVSVNVEDQLQSLLIRDKESAVRATAVRSLGVRAQTAIDDGLVNDALLSLGDDSALVRTRASWTLGNICETSGSALILQKIELISACLRLRSDDNRVTVHAIRGIGALWASTSEPDLIARRSSLVSTLSWIADILAETLDPKLRWNACAAFGRILCDHSEKWDIDTQGGKASMSRRCVFVLQVMRDGCEVAPLEVLSRVIATDRINKTRLAACNALLGACECAGREIQDHLSAQVKHDVDISTQAVAQQLTHATFRESQLHLTPLQQSLEKLKTLLEW